MEMIICPLVGMMVWAVGKGRGKICIVFGRPEKIVNKTLSFYELFDMAVLSYNDADDSALFLGGDYPGILTYRLCKFKRRPRIANDPGFGGSLYQKQGLRYDR